MWNFCCCFGFSSVYTGKSLDRPEEEDARAGEGCSDGRMLPGGKMLGRRRMLGRGDTARQGGCSAGGCWTWERCSGWGNAGRGEDARAGGCSDAPWAGGGGCSVGRMLGREDVQAGRCWTWEGCSGRRMLGLGEDARTGGCCPARRRALRARARIPAPPGAAPPSEPQPPRSAGRWRGKFARGAAPPLPFPFHPSIPSRPFPFPLPWPLLCCPLMEAALQRRRPPRPPRAQHRPGEGGTGPGCPRPPLLPAGGEGRAGGAQREGAEQRALPGDGTRSALSASGIQRGRHPPAPAPTPPAPIPLPLILPLLLPLPGGGTATAREEYERFSRAARRRPLLPLKTISIVQFDCLNQTDLQQIHLSFDKSITVSFH